ncbi:MAG: divergent polysaccharide deacetylase family protein [Sulfurimonas sp.]|nr:divergent polysaccharide deacetylase family protein [Sulfurimonas sp.]
MAKRKKNTSKVGSNILKYIAFTLAIIALVLSSLVGGYYLGYENAKTEITQKEQLKKEKRLALLKKIEQKSKKSNNNVNSRLKDVLKKESKKEIIKVKENLGASHEYASATLSKPPARIKRETNKISSKRPRLAIIIDDVSVKSQVNAIKSLGLSLTMSFLPPSKARPNSAKLAAKERFYMVHLPMEALNCHAEEPMTLHVNDSQKTIFKRVQELKKLFPKVKYINNHMGSKFTSNEVAVNRLISVLNTNNISFIDSRTTAQTKVPKVLKNFGLKYVGRDVFLDHRMDKAYVKTQIKRAIRIAKAEGVAVAIGHPHANTILALYESKKLFKDIDLVLINKIY